MPNAPVSAKSSPGATGGSANQWEQVAAMEEFKQLLKAKTRFIVPATIFFIVYYFLLPWSVGYHPQFMDKRVWGPVNIAYLFALSQFFVSWIIAWLYVRAARHFDEAAARILARLKGGK
ncbi:MAG TPA: DUF485 domain-containing protein [Candidatus Angelobacter sp.]